MPEMNQELIYKASEIQNQIKEHEQQLEFIDSQIKDLDEFTNSLNGLINSDEKEVLSLIGKGVYIKTNLVEKELFVEVGSGIVLRKSPEEAVKVISNQLDKFRDVKRHLLSGLEALKNEISGIISELQNHEENKD
jgi:prefoldin alpha subunit